MRKQRIHRAYYKTDVDPQDPNYSGAFSDPFPAEDETRRIIAVDWINYPGEVEVTWLISD